MNYSPGALGGLALVLLLGLSPAANADPIPWEFSWSRSPTELEADAPGTGRIQLTAESTTRGEGDSDVVATNLYSLSTATGGRKDYFTAKPYSLTMTLTDLDSGDTRDLEFSGKINGWITAHSSQVRNAFDDPTTWELTLGTNRYTVTIAWYTPPTIPSGKNAGSIGAYVTVTPEAIIQQLPEPGTLLLSGVGLTLLAVAGRPRASRNRRADE